jgi:4-hydroxybenzoate polyprenyltransferase
MSFLRTLLVLCRLEGLPTVASNCLAGWWLGGGGNTDRLPFLFAGAFVMYLGGAFLNDAFDSAFDQQHRRTRPIPSGMADAKLVFRLGWLYLALGVGCFAWVSSVCGGLGLALSLFIIAHSALHRVVTFSPVFLGICRFFLYVIGAAIAEGGVTGWSIWGGLVMCLYVTGSAFVDWKERRVGLDRYWPVVLLLSPVVLAFVMNGRGYREEALLLTLVLSLWTIRYLRYAWWSQERRPALTASGLQVGIVLVDWLACADGPRPLSAVFIGLFLLAVAAQRLAPK